VKKFFKPPLLYAAAAVLLLAATTLLFRIDGIGVRWTFALAQLLAFFLGILHAGILSVKAPGLSFLRALLFTFVLTAGGILIAAILYYMMHLDPRFLSCLLFFLLPVLCVYAWQSWFSIPTPVYKIWRYPLEEVMPDLDMIDLSRTLVVQLVLFKQATESSRVNFTARAPLNMMLGQLFFIFINDYNEKNPHHPIGFLDAGSGRPDAWLFHRRKARWWRKHYFDPDLSILDNGIRPNEFIFAERIY